MVSIGGYDFNFAGDAGGMMWKTLTAFFWGVVVFVIIGVVIYFIYSSWRNKTFYANPITLTMYYDNGTSKTNYGLKGGRFTNRSGVNDFRIRIPKRFKKKELGYTPDFAKADSDGTLHFITSGDGSIWQQVDKRLEVSEEQQKKDENGELMFDNEGDPIVDPKYSIVLKPVRTDVKTSTINSLKNWNELVIKQKLTVFGIGLGMFIIMVIAHLVSLFIQTKIRCPVP